MGRTCTVCAHDDRDAIDEALVSGTPYREIVKRHDAVSISALSRHSQSHVSPALAKVAAEREAAGAHTLLDRVEDLCSRVERILDAADQDNKVHVTLSAVREMRQILELLGKLTGELRDSPGTVVNVLMSPDWLAVRDAIFDALDHHPDARDLVVGRLRELEAAS